MEKEIICEICGKSFKPYCDECDECDGTGIIEDLFDEDDAEYDHVLGGIRCYICKGEGIIFETQICESCKYEE